MSFDYHPVLPMPDDVKVSDVKSCEFCKQELPLDATHFDRDNSKADGFKNTCKVCRSEQRRQQENEHLLARIHKIDAQSLQLLDRLSTGGANIPHLVEVYEQLMNAFEGPAGFARHFLSTFLMAKPGSSTRQKMLDTMLRISMKVSEQGQANVPLEHFTDEELDKKAQELAKRVILTLPAQALLPDFGIANDATISESG